MHEAGSVKEAARILKGLWTPLIMNSIDRDTLSYEHVIQF